MPSKTHINNLNAGGGFYKDGEGKQSKEIKGRGMQRATSPEKGEPGSQGAEECQSAPSQPSALIQVLSLQTGILDLLQTPVDPHGLD